MFPYELQSALEELAAGIAANRLAKDARALSERYRAGGAEGARLLTAETEAVAYSAARMPATFGAVSAALSRALACTRLRPTTLLDVGAGTGAASWAADGLLPLTRVVCMEREDAMRTVGQRLMRAGSPALREARWVPGDLAAGEGGLPESAGLVTASYVLGELREADLLPAARRLWETASGMLLLVEPGTPAGYARLRAVRDALLSDGQGAKLAAPCPQEGPCPMTGDDWCHFTCRVARSRLHRQLKGGEAPYEDEKFSYLAFVREDCEPAPARILRHPTIEPGKITLALCTPGGLRREPVRKRDGAAFKEARKARCGDAFPSRREDA